MRKPASSLLLLLALSPASRAASTDTVASARDREMLVELHERRILAPDQERWKPEDYTSLLRVREAEALGALGLLRERLGALRGLALERRRADGFKDVKLTWEGYQKFIFLKSQDARIYFEGKGAQARFVFRMTSLRGRALFDSSGILTQEGDEVFNRIKRKLPVFWRYPDGRITGNVRPSKDLLEGQAASGGGGEPAAPSSAEEAQALERLAALTSSGYVEVSQTEVEGLLAAAKVGMGQLQRESSLQVITTKRKTYYLLSPSDPLMGLVVRRRSSAPKI